MGTIKTGTDGVKIGEDKIMEMSNELIEFYSSINEITDYYLQKKLDKLTNSFAGTLERGFTLTQTAINLPKMLGSFH